MLGDASPPVTRSTGWSSQSKNRRWISSASQPPYDVPTAPCSAMSTRLVLRMLAPMVSQSMLARSSQRRSITSASTCRLLDRLEHVATIAEVGEHGDVPTRSRRTAAFPTGRQ